MASASHSELVFQDRTVATPLALDNGRGFLQSIQPLVTDLREKTVKPTEQGHERLDARIQGVLEEAAPGRSRRRIFLWMPLLLLIAGIGAVGLNQRRKNSLPAFETAELARGDLQVTVRATGTLQALTSVEVGAEVTGKLLSVHVDANDRVKKGQVLAEIDPEQLHAAVDQAAAQVAASEAAIAQAQATLNESKQNFDRKTSLRAKSFVSEAEIETATAGLERAEANLKSAKANATLSNAALKMAQSRSEKATIFSPIDGIVLARMVEPGQTVTAGFQTPVLFKLAQDLTQMRLNVDIDEADVGRVREGLEALFTVEAYPDRTFESKVISLYNEPKTSQNVVTYQAVLSVDNTEGMLRPGMTCTATIVAETKRDVLLVPNAALRFTPPEMMPKPGEKRVGFEGKPKQQVWVLEDGKPVASEVRTGLTDGIQTEVLEASIAPGTAVLTDVKEPAQ